MRRSILCISLVSLSVFCYAQQNLPSRIVGRLPGPDSNALYQIQVGAFLYARYVVITTNILRSDGFDVEFENFRNLTRVLIPTVPAQEVRSSLVRLRRLGFDSVILREVVGSFTISEKWVIPEPGSRFASFEFNHDQSFIVVERQGETRSPHVHFGEYTMPRPNRISMTDFGTLDIGQRNGETIDFSFSPIDEPETRTAFRARLEEPMPSTPETDLFTRTWRVIRSTDEDAIGTIVLFSINGTYLVSRPDGSSSISHWRWFNEEREAFEYSHNNWWNYGRARINTLREESLIFTDPGFTLLIEGFSTANQNWVYELVPITQ